MTQFHLGQEVEVATLSAGDRPLLVWHKAKITSLAQYPKWEAIPNKPSRAILSTCQTACATCSTRTISGQSSAD
jgi:hypothetical protein